MDKIKTIILFVILLAKASSDNLLQCSKEKSHQCSSRDSDYDDHSINILENIILEWKNDISDDWVKKILKKIDRLKKGMLTFKTSAALEVFLKFLNI